MSPTFPISSYLHRCVHCVLHLLTITCLPMLSSHVLALALVITTILCFCFMRHTVPLAVTSSLNPHLQLWWTSKFWTPAPHPQLPSEHVICVTSKPTENRTWNKEVSYWFSNSVLTEFKILFSHCSQLPYSYLTMPLISPPCIVCYLPHTYT